MSKSTVGIISLTLCQKKCG